MNIKEIKEWNKYFKYSERKPNKKELYDFLENSTEEDKLRQRIEVESKGHINGAMLDTCMTYGLSGNCGKICPKFQDGTCEVIDDILKESGE